MHGKEIAPCMAVLATLGATRWRFNSRIAALNKLLTDNLLALNRDPFR